VNAPERLNQEIRQRTRVVGVSPNKADCLRLVTALVMETSDKREDSKVYLVLTH
jgi:transposase-like protein